jgi:hypothetical protein
MVKLTLEDEFKLLSNELGSFFSSNFLDELAKTHKFNHVYARSFLRSEKSL